MRIICGSSSRAVRSIASLLVASILAAPGPRPPVASPARDASAVAGTFVQYQPWMMKLDREAWRLELDAMREAGITLVIVQWLEFQNVRFIPADRSAPDPTEIILDYADEHGMRVFVGLSHADLWWSRIKDPGYLDRASAKSVAVTNEAWRRYGRHASFAGWYLPQEIRDATYPLQYTLRIRTFYKKLGDCCRALSGDKPVAIAPAMSGTASPEKFGRMYAALLPGSGIDILMLQDGVGARGWETDFERRIVPYFRAIRDACRASRVALWSDVEIFRRCPDGANSEPAGVERIRRQIDAAAPFVEGFVMFDFFHYMSPRRGEAQKKLFEDYLREIVRSGSAPR